MICLLTVLIALRVHAALRPYGTAEATAVGRGNVAAPGLESNSGSAMLAPFLIPSPHEFLLRSMSDALSKAALAGAATTREEVTEWSGEQAALQAQA
jgi:hypothetical protein